MLELGEANWYGDLSPSIMNLELAEAVEDESGQFNLFKLAKIFYRKMFNPLEIVSIDFHGSDKAIGLDLNGPIDLGRQFGVVINNGTAEHIFNIAQVFKTIHEHCAAGGVMIHDGPLSGWIDHGFYTPQPTLYFDLAEVNGYEILDVYIAGKGSDEIFQVSKREDVHAFAGDERFPKNPMLFTVLKKASQESPFRVPMQAYYAGSLNPQQKYAWRALR